MICCGVLHTGFERQQQGCHSCTKMVTDLLGALVLGDGLGSFGDGVLGELTREDEAHRGLNLAGGHGFLLVVLDEHASLVGDTSEGVRDEGVEDGHRPLGDAGVRVDLLEDAVDVDVVGLAAFALVLDSLGASGTSFLENHLELGV